MNKLTKSCAILAEDLVTVVRDEDYVIALDTRDTSITVVSRALTEMTGDRFIVLIEAQSLAAELLDELRGMTDGKMEDALELEADERTAALHDPELRAKVFPALAEALR